MRYILTIILLLALSHSYAEPLAVKNPVPKQTLSMTKQEVSWIYSMKTRFWEDGTKITVYYLDRESKVHKAFVTKVLGIPVDKFDSMLATYLNSGNAGSFRMARNEQSVLTAVSLIDGSVGYLDENTLVISGGGYVAKVKITD